MAMESNRKKSFLNDFLGFVFLTKRVLIAKLAVCDLFVFNFEIYLFDFTLKGFVDESFL